MPLYPIKYKSNKIPKFEVYDIETTTDLKNVYLVGWYNGTEYKYWESAPLPPEDPNSAISLFLSWYFGRPRQCPIYAHNGGNFDQVFTLASIIANNPTMTVEIIPSQSSILMMKVIEDGHTWKFLDSARTLPDSLDNLASCFLDERKMHVEDYSTLHLNPKRYEYLQRDCTLLYRVLSKYFELLYDRIGGKAGISAASTSLATYRKSYQARPLPDISEHAAGLARAGYYGGRCEPFRREFDGGPTGQILRCYDVNSMYPWAMRHKQPVTELHMEGYHPNLTGFVEATVTVRPCHIPVLPCRTKGRLLFPYGTWRGVFSTTELRLSMETNQLTDIKFHDGVYFRTDDIFSDYVNTLYKFRDKTDPYWDISLDRMAKIGLNTLYGKFGSSEVRETIHVRPTFEDVVNKQMQQMPSAVNMDCYIEKTTTHASYMLPQISAWITALCRVKLAKALMEQGDRAYYCDTDSIFTAGTMDSGTALGEWKDEYESNPITYAYYLSPKVYVLKHYDGKVTNKAKGFAKFGEKLPANAVALLSTGQGIEVSRFAKARSVIRGEFGLLIATKRCHMEYEKRVFHEDGSSEPRKVGNE